jgi:ABC-type glycerol-3-phosphate transport system substrate-binding protein
MKKIKLVLLSIGVLVLSACGGGDSSSSVSGERYSGTQNLVVLGTSSPAAFAMVVSTENSTVTILDVSFTASGPLSGGEFKVTVPAFSETVDGVTCTFNDIVYSGTVSGANASGSISGNFSCDGIGPFSLTGNFSATKGNSKQLKQTFTQAIKTMM